MNVPPTSAASRRRFIPRLKDSTFGTNGPDGLLSQAGVVLFNPRLRDHLRSREPQGFIARDGCVVASLLTRPALHPTTLPRARGTKRARPPRALLFVLEAAADREARDDCERDGLESQRLVQQRPGHAIIDDVGHEGAQ